jgi:hypothetical protein
MANERGKAIDNTHLDLDRAEERNLIHRDYIAHVLRWTHVAKKLGMSSRYKGAYLLDVGCGVDFNMAKMLYSNRFVVPQYVAVDYNASSRFKLDMFHTGKFPLTPYGGVDFATDQVSVVDDRLVVRGDASEGNHRLPNTIVSFEVIEHVEPAHARAMLRKIHAILSECQRVHGEDVVAYISTPCYDERVGAAANHVNEMTRDALGAVLEDVGFEIVENYGTFASIRDYRDRMFEERPELRSLWDGLTDYYDTHMLANIFAPLYPQYARNNIWIVKPANEIFSPDRRFPPLESVTGPWSSSDRWMELANDSYGV